MCLELWTSLCCSRSQQLALGMICLGADKKGQTMSRWGLTLNNHQSLQKNPTSSENDELETSRGLYVGKSLQTDPHDQCKALCGDWLILPEASTNQSFSQWLTAGTLKAIRMSWTAKNSRVCPCIHRLGTELHFEVTCINVSCTLVAKSSVFESRVHLDTCGKITLHSRWGLGPWESLDESLPMWRLSSEWSDAVLFVQFCGIQVALCILYVHVEKWISWYLHVCI